jgi:hypothetical protein
MAAAAVTLAAARGTCLRYSFAGQIESARISKASIMRIVCMTSIGIWSSADRLAMTNILLQVLVNSTTARSMSHFTSANA